MIIPTFRIGDRSAYAAMARCYEEQGIGMLRVNMVRESMEVYCEEIACFRSRMKTPLEIMADIPLPGRKYRLDLPNGVEYSIQNGQRGCFTAGGESLEEEVEPGTMVIPVQANFFPCGEKTEDRSYHIQEIIQGNIPQTIQENTLKNTQKTTQGKGIDRGDRIIIGDGELSLMVEEASRQKIWAVARQSAIIRGQRSFAIPGSMSYRRYDDSFLQQYIKAFLQIRPSKIVLSFSEDTATLEEVRQKLEQALGKVAVVPKIETQAGVEHCGEICAAFPEIMLGRGDLALFSNPVEFGKNQKRVITAAQEKGANVIAATDILVSLYDHTIPVRSDLSDLYYLHELGIRDVVASAGLSMLPEWFERFCDYAEQFRL